MYFLIDKHQGMCTGTFVIQIMLALAHLGPPNASTEQEDCSIMHGLTQAVQVLCEPSSVQHNVRTSLTHNADNILNHGRILCLTSVKRYAPPTTQLIDLSHF